MAKDVKPTRNKKLAEKVRRMLAAKDKGRAAYTEAEQLFEEIHPLLEVGEQLDIGEGQLFVIVDNFATKNKAFKQAGVSRFEGKVINT